MTITLHLISIDLPSISKHICNSHKPTHRPKIAKELALPTHQDRYEMTTKHTTETEGRRHNIGFAKWRVSCFYDSLVQGSSSVFQLNICAENPPPSPSRKPSGCEITYNASQGCFFVAHVCFCCLITFI
jgi:hypothetical protein